jgi:integrase
MKTLIGASKHDDNNLFKRCGCVNPATGRRSGSLCRQLTDPGHGAWYFAVELPRQRGRRQRLRRGGYPTYAQARAARDEILGRPTGLAAGKVWTLGRWLRQWLVDISGVLRPTTVNGYTQHVRLYLAPHLGQVILADLTTRQVQTMLRTLAERRRPDGELISAATIRRVLVTLRSALGAAVREGLITTNVAAAARAPRPSCSHAVLWTNRRERNWRVDGVRPTVAVWDVHHVAEFIEHTREDRTFALWWVALLCGLRRGELAGLRWRDIDMEDKRLTGSTSSE